MEKNNSCELLGYKVALLTVLLEAVTVLLEAVTVLLEAVTVLLEYFKHVLGATLPKLGAPSAAIAMWWWLLLACLLPLICYGYQTVRDKVSSSFSLLTCCTENYLVFVGIIMHCHLLHISSSSIFVLYQYILTIKKFNSCG